MEWLTTTETVIGIILSFTALVSPIFLWVKNRQNKPVQEKESSVADRFISLFETHGVHRNQIPRFFGHDLTLADLQNEETLLPKLTEIVLFNACVMFGIRREWLDGVDKHVYECRDYYKKPKEFESFLNYLKERNPESNLSGVLVVSKDTKKDSAVILLQEMIGCIGNKEIYRYHICNNWHFSYWKSRAYLAACVAIAWKNNIYIHGTYQSADTINKLKNGETILGWKGEGCYCLGRKSWHPEDMAMEPDEFLKGIDPEENDFGIKSGLELWLELEKSGYMDSGFGVVHVEKFRKRLEHQRLNYQNA